MIRADCTLFLGWVTYFSCPAQGSTPATPACCMRRGLLAGPIPDTCCTLDTVAQAGHCSPLDTRPQHSESRDLTCRLSSKNANTSHVYHQTQRRQARS